MRWSCLIAFLVACTPERLRYGYDCAESPIPDEPNLACTGLYGEGGRGFATKTIAEDVHAYTPALVLWSDGLTKQRYLRLPPNTRIDTTDPNAWVFPVGTQLWKEMSWEGRRIETRYLTKISADAWWRSTYAWSDDESSTRLVLEGAKPSGEVAGGTYQIPSQETCDQCHDGRQDRVLGFEAVAMSLPGATGLQPHMLSQPLPPFVLEHAVGGYLHMNCGVACHNVTRDIETVAGRILHMDLRLDATRPGASPFLENTVGVLSGFPVMAPLLRIAPGDPEQSAVYVRMASLRLFEHMPPVGTRLVDKEALRDLHTFISELRP